MLALIISIATFFAVTSTFQPGSSLSTSTLSGNPIVIRNITYCNIDNYPEQMDIYIPSPNLSDSADPVAMYVHGGGWINGSKTTDWEGVFPLLLSNGFIVASIDYFMPLPSPAFPLNVEDLACAARFLRSNAAHYHIDPNHIGLLGDSAGGNLVSLEALAAINGSFDKVGQYTNYSSQVQAVVDAFGPANLTDPSFNQNSIATRYTSNDINLTQFVFGGSYANLISASPTSYASSERAPPLPYSARRERHPSSTIAIGNALQ